MKYLLMALCALSLCDHTWVGTLAGALGIILILFTSERKHDTWPP